MAQFSDAVRAKMQAAAQTVKESMKQTSRTARVFDLTGKNAIVQPGQGVFGRVLPRWDIADKFINQGGQWVLNPNYEDDLVYHVAWEHWWDDNAGKPNRAWCLKNGGEELACPLCEASDELKASADSKDREVGKRVAAKKAFLFNFILGRTGKRALTEKGGPDIGVLSASNTIFVALTGFMTGGSADDENQTGFARGDITDPNEGFDVVLKRPAAQGDRWTADCAPQPSPLYTAQEKQVFDGWVKHLVDLPAMVDKELEAYATLYQRYTGRPPEQVPGGGGDSFTTDADSFPTDEAGASAVAAGASDPWATHVEGPASGRAPFNPPASGFTPPPTTAPKKTPPTRPSARR